MIYALTSTHQAIKKAQQQQYRAKILPQSLPKTLFPRIICQLVFACTILHSLACYYHLLISGNRVKPLAGPFSSDKLVNPKMLNFFTFRCHILQRKLNGMGTQNDNKLNVIQIQTQQLLQSNSTVCQRKKNCLFLYKCTILHSQNQNQ